VVGDNIKSFHIDNLPDESLGKDRYRGFQKVETTGEEGDTEVKNVWFDFNPGYFDINNLPKPIDDWVSKIINNKRK